jgi:long-chain acyl-CoA synthetase
MNTLGEILDFGLAKFPDKLALEDKKNRYTYQELNQACLNFMAYLSQNRIKTGDIVGLFSENSTAFIIALLSCYRAGLICTLIEAQCKLNRLQLIAEGARLKHIIISEMCRRSYDNQSNELNVRLDVEFIELKNSSEDTNDHSFAPLTTLESDAQIIYSSGSTSEAKGVILTQKNIIAALKNISTYIGYTDQDHEVVTLPLTHSYGLNHVLCNLMNGGSTCILPGLLSIKSVFKALKDPITTGFPQPPSGLRLLFKRYGSAFIEAAQSLRFMVVNSERLPKDQALEIMEALPNCKILIYYGLTEASRTTFHTLDKNQPELLDSIGKATPNVKLALFDSEFNPVETGESGQLAVKAETVFKGYLNTPEQTQKAFHNDWFLTGDLAKMDQEGFIFLTGRIKDIINIGGLKVSPGEINKVYLEHPDIAEFFAIELENKLQGEEVLGCVVLKHGKTLNDADLGIFGASYLEPYKVPSRFMYLDSLPKNEFGKVQRKTLQEIALEHD